MPVIEKAKETMTAKQRVQKTFNHERTDRVPIGYEANGAVHARFAAALGAADITAVWEAIGVDYRGVWPQYTGPVLFGEAPDGLRIDPLDGYRTRWITNAFGGYWDFCAFPLQDAAEEDFNRYPLPSPDDFDYETAADYVHSLNNQYSVFIGGAGVPDVINANGRIMGMEDVLCHLALGNEAALAFMARRAQWQLGVMERLLARCKDQIDFVWLGEDLGTQIGPMISLPLYRTHIKPIHKIFCDLANSYGLPVLIHTCGSSSWAYEDFIEIGVSAVDTLQPEAVQMSPAYLKSQFGNRLGYRGCISTAGALANGSVQEVTAVCKETLRIMMDGYGYHFAPTHAIQDNTPTENVIAMYNAAHRYGVYT